MKQRILVPIENSKCIAVEVDTGNPDRYMCCGDWNGYRLEDGTMFFWNSVSPDQIRFCPEDCSFSCRPFGSVFEAKNFPVSVVRWMLSSAMTHHGVKNPYGLPW